MRLYGAPGGHFEYGETFAGCAARELKEELGIDVQESELSYLTTLNVVVREENFHYCNIFMVAVIDGERAGAIVNKDAHKCMGWEWIPYGEYVKREDVFHSFRELFKAGYNDLKVILS